MQPSCQALGSLVTAVLATAPTDVDSGTHPRAAIGSCASLSCEAPDRSICGGGEGQPGPPVGVGIAPQVVDSPAGPLSLTLIDGWRENGFTEIGSDACEHPSLQPFAGAGAGGQLPLGCALVMQYRGQTEQVQAELPKVPGACGGEGARIANFMNVTGGALPVASSTPAQAAELGDNQCRAMLPQNYGMYEVASMRQFTFANSPGSASGFLRNLYEGRAGFTPVATAIYGLENDDYDDDIPDAQFVCMKTFQQDGGARDDSSGSGTAALSGLRRGVPVAAALALW